MISPDYINKTKAVIAQVTDPAKFFIFGSATRRDFFGDVDLGTYDASEEEVARLREKLEQSTLPFFCDVVNFSRAKESFTNYVNTNEHVLWLT